MRFMTSPSVARRALVRKGAAFMAAAAIATVTLLSACSSATESVARVAETASEVEADITVASAMAENHDYWTPLSTGTEPGSVEIQLAGSTATSSSSDVSVGDGRVTISAGGSYTLSGEFSGQIVVDARDEDEVILVLDGVDLAAEGQAALLMKNADGVSVILADGARNSISDSGDATTGEAEDAALYSETDLQISGSGSLTVTGVRSDGIASSKDLVITGGVIDVTAADDGVRGKDALVILDGAVSVEALGDALKSNNSDEADRGYVYIQGGTLALSAAGDAIDAETDALMAGGTIVTAPLDDALNADEQVSGKGLKSGVLTVIENGDLEITATDDAVHSNGSVHISSGSLKLASDDDGVHADDALTIDGGSVQVVRSVEGLEASSLTIAGGEVAVTSSDDGLNASSSTESVAGETEALSGGETPNGARPEGDGMGGGEFGDDGSILVISGGALTVNAEGDGIDSNGSLQISGGTTSVFGTSRGGNGAFDSNGEFEVSGGTVLAISAGQMEQEPTAGEQGWVAASVSGAAGAAIVWTDAEHAELAAATAKKSFGYVFFSHASVFAGDSYLVSVDGAETSATAGEPVASGFSRNVPGGPSGVAPTTDPR